MDPLAAVNSKSDFACLSLKRLCGTTDKSAPVSIKNLNLDFRSVMNSRLD